MPDDNIPVSPNVPTPSIQANTIDSNLTNTTFPQSQTPTPGIIQENKTPPNESANEPEAVVTSPHVPKKYGGTKVIATIFSLILIMGAVATGVYLIQTQQLRIGQAWDCSKYVFVVSQNGTVTAQNGSSRSESSQQAKVFINSQQVATCNVPALDPGEAATICTVPVPESGGFSWRVDGTKDCDDSGSYTPRATPTPQPTPTLTSTPTLGPTPTASPSPTPSLTPTPSPTLPAIGGACSEVRAYDTNWNLLSSNDLSSLEEGNVIRFAVAGTATSGFFDKARFTINGSLRSEVTTKKPGSSEFYDEYTVPSGMSSFTISAQVHHSTLGWF